MPTRDQFLKQLRQQARKDKKSMSVAKNQGKGSHYRVTYDGSTTTVKSGQLSPAYVKLLKKQLGI